MQIANASEGVSSKCLHLWTSRRQRVSLDACITEAYARSGDAINHDPVRHRCNVKRCSAPPAADRRYNDIKYDVVVDRANFTEFDYRRTDEQGAWDVYAIIRQLLVLSIITLKQQILIKRNMYAIVKIREKQHNILNFKNCRPTTLSANIFQTQRLTWPIVTFRR